MQDLDSLSASEMLSLESLEDAERESSDLDLDDDDDEDIVEYNV